MESWCSSETRSGANLGRSRTKNVLVNRCIFRETVITKAMMVLNKRFGRVVVIYKVNGENGQKR